MTPQDRPQRPQVRAKTGKIAARSPLEAPHIALRRSKRCPGAPKSGQDHPKRSQERLKSPQERLRGGQDLSLFFLWFFNVFENSISATKTTGKSILVPQGPAKSAQEPPKSGQDRPKSAQDRPKTGSDRPKSGPRRDKSGPRRAKSGPRRAKSDPRAAKSGPKSPRSAQERPRPAKTDPRSPRSGPRAPKTPKRPPKTSFFRFRDVFSPFWAAGSTFSMEFQEFCERGFATRNRSKRPCRAGCRMKRCANGVQKVPKSHSQVGIA